MVEFFNSLDGLGKTYLFCALFGTLLFVIRTGMSFLGGDTDVDGDFDADFGDMEADLGEADSDTSFKILSLQAFTGFFMMFGLVGLAMLESDFETAFSIPAAVVAGLFSIWILDRVYNFLKGLQHSGTLNLEKAVGEEGTVYLTIPETGIGKVQVPIQGRLKEVSAVAKNRQKIPTGERIRVEGVVRGNVFTVSKVESDSPTV